jgi:hypothetical protein
VEAVRIYGLSRSGRATELGYGPGAAFGNAGPSGPRELRLNGRRFPVVAGVIEGFADSSSLAAQVIAVELPSGTATGGYDWLEIESRSPLQANGFMLSDRATAPERAIFFKTLDRGSTKVRVLVGACSQWHGYRSGRLYLRVDRREQIAAVRLYR